MWLLHMLLHLRLLHRMLLAHHYLLQLHQLHLLQIWVLLQLRRLQVGLVMLVALVLLHPCPRGAAALRRGALAPALPRSSSTSATANNDDVPSYSLAEEISYS